MESLLTVLGLLFFMLLVLAASVEAILEMFRGLLESIGITFLKGKYSVEDALKLAGEFASGDDAIKTKLEAVKGVAQQLGAKVSTRIAELETLKANISSTAGVPVADAAAILNKITTEVQRALDSSESTRIFILRLLPQRYVSEPLNSFFSKYILTKMVNFHYLLLLIRV
ncbi:hypothetical protein LOY38_13570 [Pseudomonas sp. B21-015]|uniref:hypothetical protein n=1 Tax=Pseudomonas sp. B21-015 TaxID=2895473 RepID=UPI002160F3D8|nr:hypothetical protein [Pseudomonas sp. B21-015]UVM52978.1 hypothetical protein LOY38_13570 [Pseudomonas sp. B21-015]